MRRRPLRERVPPRLTSAPEDAVARSKAKNEREKEKVRQVIERARVRLMELEADVLGRGG